MHVAELTLENWMPYRGEHVLRLEPIAYAVTAQRDRNPDSSNWSGKSALLEAIRFAFYGTHRHRFEEGWVSEGEKSGGVTLVLSNGIVVRRWRAASGGTKLEVRQPGGSTAGGDASKDEKLFAGDVAQRRVEQILGLGAEDFGTTSFFAQGAISSMIRADPATRTATVARWLRLEPLAACAKSVGGKADGLARDLERLRGKEEAARQRLARALTDGSADEVVMLVQLRERVPSLERELADADGALKLAREWDAGERLAAERARVRAEGVALLREHKAEDGEALVKVLHEALARDEEARAIVVERQEVFRQRATVAKGTFGGQCPVSGRGCPVSDEINRSGESATREAKDAQKALLAAQEHAQGTWRTQREANDRVLARDVRATRLTLLRDQLRRLDADAGQRVYVGPPEELQARRDAFSTALLALKAKIAEAEGAEAEIARLEKQTRAVIDELEVCREARAILGRSGAQRRLAEGVLTAIGARANGMLSAIGADLSLDIVWERECKGLADDCDVCGAAYPSSAKVKRCGSCGAERGPKRVQRLDVDLSARSGAAEDLAGLALSLAAGQHLRIDRGSPWSLVLLDEPTAQLDKSHRRAFAQHVPALLAAAHVQQALVVSHDPASVASLPGAIEIRSDGRWATVAVAV